MFVIRDMQRQQYVFLLPSGSWGAHPEQAQQFEQGAAADMVTAIKKRRALNRLNPGRMVVIPVAHS